MRNQPRKNARQIAAVLAMTALLFTGQVTGVGGDVQTATAATAAAASVTTKAMPGVRISVKNERISISTTQDSRVSVPGYKKVKNLRAQATMSVPVKESGTVKVRVGATSRTQPRTVEREVERRVVNPLKKMKVTSKMGMRRHPVTGIRRLHTGTDFRASMNTPVRSVASGKVTRVYWTRTGGRSIEIDHGIINGKRVWTRYLHLKKKTRVKKGDSVSAGQVIARSGNTGVGTGPHLHFEVSVGKRLGWVDPVKWLRANRT